MAYRGKEVRQPGTEIGYITREYYSVYIHVYIIRKSVFRTARIGNSVYLVPLIIFQWILRYISDDL